MTASSSRRADYAPPSAKTGHQRWYRRLFSWISNLGTEGYPPDSQRRLKIINVISALIAMTTFGYAINQSMIDFEAMKPVVLINLGLGTMMLLVPLMHRINDMAGGLLVVVSELVALMVFTAYFGRAGGAQLQYIIAAAAPFVIFGPKRMWLVISIVVAALALHLYAWFSFNRANAILSVDQSVLRANYIQGAVTTFGLIAASVYYAFSLAERAKAETENVLRNVLPDSVVERLKSKPDETIADGFAQASILFADIAGFVELARRLGPEKTVALLNRLVSSFDDLAQQHGVEKIKTIGDAYMVAAGVPVQRSDCAKALAEMALDMITAANDVSRETGIPLNVRIGMATGPMMAGIIGKKKFSYDVWGDPVNLASRLESASTPGRILVCPQCHDALTGYFTLEPRGAIDIKGVGLQDAWYLTGRL